METIIILFQNHYETWEQVGTRPVPISEQIFYTAAFIIGMVIAFISLKNKK